LLAPKGGGRLRDSGLSARTVTINRGLVTVRFEGPTTPPGPIRTWPPQTPACIWPIHPTGGECRVTGIAAPLLEELTKEP